LAGLKGLDATIEEIFTSPLVRARQTADLLAAGVRGRPTVKLLDALAPGHPPATVMAQLAKSAKRRCIALVGHEPDLGELAAQLIRCAPGAAVQEGRHLPDSTWPASRPKAAGTLVWFVTPKILRKLAS
jgi:phosphohistidine phosphatase